MLILKVFVNDKQIDEMQIQNVEQIGNEKSDLYAYRIMRPEGLENVRVIHNPRKPWIHLVCNALHRVVFGNKDKHFTQMKGE